MYRKIKTALLNTAFATILTMLATSAGAVVVVADTTGTDSASDADYYGISFASGAGSIASITYDLTVDAGAFFDFDAPNITPGLGTLVGITAADISFEFGSFVGGDTSHPAILTLNFASGSFTAGDLMRFSADTDSFFGGPPNPGGDFGGASVPISAMMTDGSSGSATFARISDTVSTATISIDAVAVPEPATIALLALGLVGAGYNRRRKIPLN